MKNLVLIFVLALLNSCSSQQNDHEENVSLEFEYGWLKEFNTYYETGSNQPFTGQFVCNSPHNNITIDFKNGRMDGEFVRFNPAGDTTEYMTYKNGRKTYRLDLQYENGQVMHRGEHIITKGSIEDKQLFDKVSNYMIAEDYAALDNLLNPMSTYEHELKSITNQFGRLNSIKITEISSEFDVYNQRADIRARVILSYENIEMDVSFLIVKYESGELKGQGFGYKPIDHELIPDNKIVDVLSNLDNASSDYKFLDTKILPGRNMVFIKNYLVEIDGKEQVLNLWYQRDANNKMTYSIHHIKPVRRPFEGMHWN